ncbi:MAG: ATP-binding cassette domain-containing protein [Halobacteriovoraceae bacterium]|nr:ATP-binding cassette domain-containing protein [Halobacteriovoraceae bacterium]
MTLLKIENQTIQNPHVKIHVSQFLIEPGTFHYLIGETGSGKSTFLKSFAHNEGILYIPSTIPGVEKTVEEFIKNILGFKKWQKTIEEFKSFLSKNDIHEIDFTKKISQLSSGQRQILNISLGLFLNPKLLLLDEAMVNLDAKLKKKFWKLLKNWVDSSKSSLVITSHEDLSLAHQFSGIWSITSGELKRI